MIFTLVKKKSKVTPILQLSTPVQLHFHCGIETMVILRKLGHISFILNLDYYSIRQCIAASTEFIERLVKFQV